MKVWQKRILRRMSLALNRQQRIILAGCLLVTGTFLFPPYIGIRVMSGDNTRAYIGYG